MNALPSQDSATGRAAKTFVQTVIGFLIGLVLVVWAVPGVPEAVIRYFQQNIIQLALLIGVPSGLTSLVWNLFRSDVPHY